MSSEEIRNMTRYIVRKNGEYLVGKIIFSTDLRWSNNKYDAWWTKDPEQAEEMARRTGGIVMRFNPLDGRVNVET